MVSRPGLHARRQLRRIARRVGHVQQVDPQIGAGHGEDTVGEGNVLRGDLQKVRGDLARLADDRAPGLVERGAADRDRARAAGQARRRAVGIAHDDVDAVGVDAELIRDQLLVRGDEAGAVFLVAHHQFDPFVLELD